MDKIRFIQNKCVSAEAVDALLQRWRLKDRRIVFTNGCFDLLHRGHVQLLAAAASQGNVLVVGLNDDASVRRLKGPQRPINRLEDRALVLASLHWIDAVVPFSEDTPMELIRRIRPDVLVKGGDYRLQDIVGAELVQSYGGTVYIYPTEAGYSTTQLAGQLLKGGAAC